jgi:hypothetical protein
LFLEHHKSHRGAIAYGVGGATVAVVLALSVGAVPASTGCTTHQCDQATVPLGGAGQMPLPGSSEEPLADGELVWRSSPAAGPWLDFPGLRTYVLTYPQPFVCPPDPAAWLAGDNTDAQSGFLTGAGGLALFAQTADPDGLYRTISVTNPACGEFGLLVEVRGLPVGTPSPWCLMDGGNVVGDGVSTADDATAPDAGVLDASGE